MSVKLYDRVYATAIYKQFMTPDASRWRILLPLLLIGARGPRFLQNRNGSSLAGMTHFPDINHRRMSGVRTRARCYDPAEDGHYRRDA